MVNTYKLMALNTITIVFIAGLKTQALATSASTPASIVSSGVAYALECLAKQEANKATVDINDLSPFLNMDNANSQAQGSLDARINLFGSKGPIRGDEQVIAITRNQIASDVKPSLGRYVIWKKKDVIDVRWESEETVAAIFKENNTVLPNSGIWKQPDLQSVYDFGIKPPPGKPPTKTVNPHPEENSLGTEVAQKSNAGKPTIQQATLPQTESKLWLLWLLVVPSGLLIFWRFLSKLAKK